MTAPLVTIVTPSFNQGHFIRATIESVLGQDYPNLEYIIMDGGSTDGTAAVAAEYSSRLTFISEKDRGQSHAINKGFRMAKGEITAWLNSDDLLLPGAVATAVEAFSANPEAAAIYGEGYLMDREGNLTSRFPHTQPLDLWRLMYLSDYVLQQSVFFRRGVLQEIGYLREELHYVMDWDLLIRIAQRYPLHYVQGYLGCLREYPEAKSFAGGARRIREIGRVLREHTGRRIPPGLIVYGLDTYSSLICDRIRRGSPAALQRLSETLQLGVAHLCGFAAGMLVGRSQGWYPDGWVGHGMRYMLPRGKGTLVLEGFVPGSIWLRGQTVRVDWNSRSLGSYGLKAGEFQMAIPVDLDGGGGPAELSVEASHSFIPAASSDLSVDQRRVAFMLRRIGWRGEYHYPPGMSRA